MKTLEDKNIVKRLFVCASVTGLLILCNANLVMASDFGKNFGEWALDQLFWVGLVGMAFGLVACLVTRAFSKAITLLLVGAPILAIIQNSELIKTIGTAIGNVVFKAGS